MMNQRIAARVFGLALGVAVAALTGTGTAQQLTAATPAEIAIDNFAFEPAVLMIRSSSGQRRLADREPLRRCIIDLADSEHGFELVRLNLHRAGPLALAGRRLRE